MRKFAFLLTGTELTNGFLTALVAAAPSLRGRMVERRQPLNAKSTAKFNLALAHSTVRVATGVNQAGAGDLGSFTHPFLYRAL